MAIRSSHQRGAAQQRKVLILDPGTPGSLRSLVAAYLAHIQVRHYRPSTITTNTGQLRLFVEWAEERGVMDGVQVSAAVMERYQRWLYHQYRQANGRPLTIRAQVTRLMVVSALFSWAVKTKRVPANPSADLDLPKTRTALPRYVLTRSDVAAVLAQPDLTTAKGVRDRAIMELLYSTGIRRTELVGVTLYDIERERGLVLVREGKFRKDRYVPLGVSALAWIDRYLAEVRPGLVMEPDQGRLFLNMVGEALSACGLGTEIRGYFTAAGIRQRGSCHLFRHACATHLLEAGCDIRYIQELLGHESLETTAIYTRVTVGALKAMHAKFHPSETRADASPVT